MKLFLDTANIDEIRDGARLGVVSGVTTNPSLAASAGIGDREAYRSAVAEIASLIDGPISVEVVSTDTQGMVDEGRDIAGWIRTPADRRDGAPWPAAGVDDGVAGVRFIEACVASDRDGAVWVDA